MHGLIVAWCHLCHKYPRLPPRPYRRTVLSLYLPGIEWLFVILLLSSRIPLMNRRSQQNLWEMPVITPHQELPQMAIIRARESVSLLQTAFITFREIKLNYSSLSKNKPSRYNRLVTWINLRISREHMSATILHRCGQRLGKNFLPRINSLLIFRVKWQ